MLVTNNDVNIEFLNNLLSGNMVGSGARAPVFATDEAAKGPAGDAAAPDLTATENVLFQIPVFLSIAYPYNELQTIFLNRVILQIQNNLLFPRTLIRTDQYTEPPVTSIRRMILSSYGLIAIAFKRAYVTKAVSRPGAPREETFNDFWLTSPYLQIEPSMAYQQGLPVTIFVERGVSMNSVFGGILELGAAPFNIVTFDLNSAADIPAFFQSANWKQTFLDWVGEVRTYYNLKTVPTLS